MKQPIFLMIGSLIVVSLACALPELPSISQESLTGSGNVVTREEAIFDFDKVDISHSFEVDIKQGENFSVVISIDDNLVEHLQVEKQGSTLKIGLKDSRGFLISNATMEAEVTMPELTGLDISGASRATITGFESAENLILNISGSSSLAGDISTGNVSIDLSGSSEVSLSGSGQNLTIDVSGSSELDLSNFPVADAKIDASGASSVTVNSSGRLDVDASGASHVYYLGGPSMGTIDTSGASSVEPK
jgi:hypothetical protein